MIPPIAADAGGLLRALARTPSGQPSFPEYERILISAATIIVPALVLAEVDYFLRAEHKAMRRLIAEIFDPATRQDLDLGLVDGTVAAVAERRSVYRVLTSDRRDFSAIRVGPRLTRALDLLP